MADGCSVSVDHHLDHHSDDDGFSTGRDGRSVLFWDEIDTVRVLFWDETPCYLTDTWYAMRLVVDQTSSYRRFRYSVN